MIYENILEAAGNTPLIRLQHMTGEDDAQILVKFEAVNVGASIKTRTALGMIENHERYCDCGADKRKSRDRTCTDRCGKRISHNHYHAGFSQRGKKKAGTPVRGRSTPDSRCREYRGLYSGMP